MAAVPLILVAESCHYCSKHRHPKELIRIPGGGQRICWHCYQWHLESLKLLSGQPPKGCQTCGLQFADLEKQSADGNITFVVQVKDGIYQIQCGTCGDAYRQKRRDLYEGTAFGRDQNLW